jgi:hypothetical protein
VAKKYEPTIAAAKTMSLEHKPMMKIWLISETNNLRNLSFRLANIGLPP